MKEDIWLYDPIGGVIDYKGIKIGKTIFPDDTFVWEINLNQFDNTDVSYNEVTEYLKSISPKEIKKYDDGTSRYIFKL